MSNDDELKKLEELVKEIKEKADQILIKSEHLNWKIDQIHFTTGDKSVSGTRGPSARNKVICENVIENGEVVLKCHKAKA